MYAQPNCLVDVHSATLQDTDGDDVQATDEVTPRIRAVPMSILERTRRVIPPASLTPVTIRIVTGRCNRTVPIQSDDMLHDTRNDRWYSITSLTRGDSTVLPGELVMDLQRTE